MPLRLLPLIFLLPLAASAECGFMHGAQGMTIVVGKSDRCFQSDSFRETFRTSLVAAVQAMDGGASGAARHDRSIDARTARGAKLWAIAERQHHNASGGAAYYGQR